MGKHFERTILDYLKESKYFFQIRKKRSSRISLSFSNSVLHVGVIRKGEDKPIEKERKDL